MLLRRFVADSTSTPLAHVTFVTRRAFLTCFLIPLLLAVVIAIVWARSFRLLDEWSLATDKGEVRAVFLFRGAVHYTTGGTNAATRPISHDSHHLTRDATFAEIYTNGTLLYSRLGFHKFYSKANTYLTTRPQSPFGPPSLAADNPIPFIPINVASIYPLWPLAALCALPPISYLIRQWRRRHRELQGLCPRCRYDLRASPNRCPECGWNR